jgi:hypothetical protein
VDGLWREEEEGQGDGGMGGCVIVAIKIYTELEGTIASQL